MQYDRDYFEGRTSYFYQFGGYRDVGSYFNRLARWFRPHAPAGPLLDVGCAYGFLLSRFADGRDLAGCDVSEWALAKARERLPHARLHLLNGDGGLPFRDGEFNTVLCTDVIEHLPRNEQPRALSEIARVLAPGGTFCMTTPNLGLFRRLLYARADRAEEHVGMCHVSQWAAELPRYGLQVIKHWTYLNGFLPGRLRGRWLPECAMVSRKDATGAGSGASFACPPGGPYEKGA